MGKNCAGCHIKRLECPAGIAGHLWKNICLPEREKCTDWNTCPTKYEKGHSEEVKALRNQEKATQKVQDQQAKEQAKIEKEKQDQQQKLTKQEQKEKEDKEANLKLASKFTAG